MLRYLLRRILHAVLLVFVTLTATFFILHIAPGDPLSRYYSADIDPRAMDTVRQQLGLDDPLPVQYLRMITSFARGDFGVSIQQQRPVSAVLRETIPRTLLLTVSALALQLLIGLSLGVFAVLRRNTRWDRVLAVTSLLFYALPAFYLAYLLIALFSLKLGWLPAAGVTSLGGGGAADRLAHMVLPVTVLAVGSAAVFASFTRGRLLDAFHEEFVVAARAKGVSERSLVWKHSIKIAAPQLLTLVGLSIPYLLAGSAVVEKVFAWPGMGALFVDAIYARDYPVVLAVNFIAAVMVIVSNLVVDVAHFWVDPRVRDDLAGQVVT